MGEDVVRRFEIGVLLADEVVRKGATDKHYNIIG